MSNPKIGQQFHQKQLEKINFNKTENGPTFSNSNPSNPTNRIPHLIDILPLSIAGNECLR